MLRLDLKSKLPGIETIDIALADVISAQLEQPQEGLLYHSVLALSHALRMGHVCLDLNVLAETCWWHDQDSAGYWFPEMDSWGSMLTELGLYPDAALPLVYEHQRLYLRRYWRFEQDAATRLGELSQRTTELDTSLAHTWIERLFGQNEQAVDWQKLAVANALDQGFSVIAGGPGTGKTYTVTRLLAIKLMLAETPLRIALAAPTGKAAQRLNESVVRAKASLHGLVPDQVLEGIPDQAMTLHRLLGATPNGVQFKHDERHPLALDLLLVDEASMIDLPMLARLLRALPVQASLILLGDPDQLPSVAAGGVLADLAPRPHPGYSSQRSQYLRQLTGISSLPDTQGKALDHLVYLQRGYRFETTGAIGRLSTAVQVGEADEAWSMLEAGDEDCCLAGQPDWQDWVESIAVRHYLPVTRSVDVATAISLLKQFRLLTATRVGERGAEEINRLIDSYIRDKLRVDTSQPHYPGMPVMVARNHYGLQLFNGDQGVIWPHPESGALAVVFEAGDSLRWVSPGRIPDIEPVYAMTIHKTQGSEYDRLALVLPEADSAVLSRELAYTGITRAKQSLVVNATAEVWRTAIKRRIERYSGLALRLNQPG